MRERPQWEESRVKFSGLQVCDMRSLLESMFNVLGYQVFSTGTIEDDGFDMLQVARF